MGMGRWRGADIVARHWSDAILSRILRPQQSVSLPVLFPLALHFRLATNLSLGPGCMAGNAVVDLQW